MLKNAGLWALRNLYWTSYTFHPTASVSPHPNILHVLVFKKLYWFCRDATKINPSKYKHQINPLLYGINLFGVNNLGYHFPNIIYDWDFFAIPFRSRGQYRGQINLLPSISICFIALLTLGNVIQTLVLPEVKSMWFKPYWKHRHKLSRN